MHENDWTLVIHGGAGIMERGKLASGQEEGAREGLARALDTGSAVVADGGSALDAVSAAVAVLEDNPHFNAGRGAALTHDGTAELDAAIMDGRDRSAGAVAGVSTTRSPVALARAVMERSPHVMLSGSGADEFAVEDGLEQVDPDWFATPERRAQLAELRARGGEAFDVEMKYGTVGAVARDVHGHLAAATSTGGVTGKRWGRIGDSPIIGAGTWADDRTCAVSCTGAGEYFLRVGASHQIAARVQLAGASTADATATVLADIAELGGTGGAIVVGRNGMPVWSFTTPGMYRARATGRGERLVAIFGDEG